MHNFKQKRAPGKPDHTFATPEPLLFCFRSDNRADNEIVNNQRSNIKMINNSVRLAILALILSNATNAFSDQKIKTKSNIKNDRVEQPASPDVKSSEETTANSASKPSTNVDTATKNSSENMPSAVNETKKTSK